MKYHAVRYRIWLQKVKSFGAFVVILLLLPYVVTVFVHGADWQEGIQQEWYVRVIQPQLDGTKESMVTEIPWETYFIGLLALESEENSEVELLKAQAVLIRTRLYQQMKEDPKRVFSERYLSREEMEKRWGGQEFKTIYENLKCAMKETANQVLYYGENYAWTPYHQSSNGMTRSAEEVLGTDAYPYLTVQECPCDKEAQEEIRTCSYSYEEIQTKCQPFLVAVEKEEAEKIYRFEEFEILSYDSAGYVKELRIGKTICTGDQFRDALGLASSDFSLQEQEGKLRITTTGNGHGMGMSQWTANEMAKEGSSYEEILQFFFAGTELREGEEVRQKI